VGKWNRGGKWGGDSGQYFSQWCKKVMMLKHNKNHNALLTVVNHLPENSPIGTKLCYYSIQINIVNPWKINLKRQYSILPSHSIEGCCLCQIKDLSFSEETWEAEKSHGVPIQ